MNHTCERPNFNFEYTNNAGTPQVFVITLLNEGQWEFLNTITTNNLQLTPRTSIAILHIFQAAYIPTYLKRLKQHNKPYKGIHSTLPNATPNMNNVSSIPAKVSN